MAWYTEYSPELHPSRIVDTLYHVQMRRKDASPDSLWLSASAAYSTVEMAASAMNEFKVADMVGFDFRIVAMKTFAEVVELCAR